MSKSLRIVVADDETDMVEYFQRVLPRLGHQVVGVASNGRELLDLCGQVNPDLIITDARMPELDGLEAIIQLRKQTAIPALIVSAHPDRTAGRAEPNHLRYLHKPFRQADLEAALATLWSPTPRLADAGAGS